MHTPSQVNPDVVDPPPVLLRVSNVYDCDLDAEGESDLLGTNTSSEVDVRSSLRWTLPLFTPTASSILLERRTPLLVSSCIQIGAARIEYSW